MGLARLGKRKHKVLRDPRQISDKPSGLGFKNGEPVMPDRVEVSIFANIQSSFSPYHARQLKQGDREKDAIWFSSDDWVFEARVGSNPADADYIVYNNTYWKVSTTMPYGNFGTHVEGIAVKINPNEFQEVYVNRKTEKVGVIGE